MAAVTRLVTVVDIDDGTGAPPPNDPWEMSLSAVLLAVLSDGRRLTLLDDRGWSMSGPADIWRRTSAATIAADARAVVGPDEPDDGRAPSDVDAEHWAHLAGILRRRRVHVDPRVLSLLPHDVELSERLRARLGG